MAASESSDGPVLNLMNKRLRNLRKKYNRILQTEEAISQGKAINKDQEDVLNSKSAVLTLIDEYEKLRQPLSLALHEELNLAHQHQQVSATPPSASPSPPPPPQQKQSEEPIVEDLLKLLYFGSLFDVKPQSDFASTMYTRAHERESCLTYDYFTEEVSDMLGEKDLDMISMLGGLVISRPKDSNLSHKNALKSCIERAKLWLSNSDESIESGSSLTYKGLRERLNKIMATEYFTTSPEMKASVEVAAAVEKFGACQVPVLHASVPEFVPVQTEGAFIQNEEKVEEISNSEGPEVVADQSSPDEESPKNESGASNPAVAISIQLDHPKSEADSEEQNFKDEGKEQQNMSRRNNYQQNHRGGSRGGGGGRRGYPNGRGGRSSSSRGGGYQNGRSQYYEQPGNYYPRNSYSTRGRGGRGPGGYNNQGSGGSGAVHVSHEE